MRVRKKSEKRILASSYLCLLVCPSARMEQLGCHRTDFYEIWYLSIFRKSVKIKTDKNNGHFSWKLMYIFLAGIFLEWKMFQAKVTDKIKPRILCSKTFCRKSCLLYDNVEKYRRAGQARMVKWSVRIACWIPKATNTHSQYLTLTAFPLQQWLHEGAWVLRYTYIGCLVCVGFKTYGIRGRTINYANSPPCACRGSTGQKP